jgi:hypothetical protein
MRVSARPRLPSLLDERQQGAELGSIWRFFDRHGISFKKSVRAAEQDRPDVAAARTAWTDNQPKLDPDRLVFIDETGTSIKMAQLCGWAPRGERLVGKISHGHWKTTTFVAAVFLTGGTACLDLAQRSQTFCSIHKLGAIIAPAPTQRQSGH